MTRFPDRDSRPRHADTQDALMHMIGGLQVVGNFGGYQHLRDEGAASLRLEAISTLSSARRDLERCTFNPDAQVMYNGLVNFHNLVEPRMRTHTDLISWINELSIELKLLHNLPHQAKDITAEQLEHGKRLINELDTCREQLRFER